LQKISDQFLGAYDGEAMKKSSVFEQHKWFKEGSEKVEEDEGSGCPRSQRTNANAEKVQKLVHFNRHLSINQAYYVKMLMWLREAVHRKRHELWPNDWILHDNASAHKMLSAEPKN
jgi:hypothetical protein